MEHKQHKDYSLEESPVRIREQPPLGNRKGGARDGHRAARPLSPPSEPREPLAPLPTVLASPWTFPAHESIALSALSYTRAFTSPHCLSHQNIHCFYLSFSQFFFNSSFQTSLGGSLRIHSHPQRKWRGRNRRDEIDNGLLG